MRPIFGEASSSATPRATPDELARALWECVEAGARVVNLSLAPARPLAQSNDALERALDHAAHRGVLVVAAAGNQDMIGSSAITRHPWVIPVVGCDLDGRPMRGSNLAATAGARGLRAPGRDIVSLGLQGEPMTMSGTSFAAAFVTGAIALLWSEFFAADAAQIKLALRKSPKAGRRSIVPPLFDAEASYRIMSQAALPGAKRGAAGDRRANERRIAS